MRYAAVVLRNIKNPISLVDYTPVVNAFTDGGVDLDEIVFLSYEEPILLQEHLARLYEDCNGLFIICDTPLLTAARGAIEQLTGSNEEFPETPTGVCGVLLTGKAGADTVRAQVISVIDRKRDQRFCRVHIGVCGAPVEKIRAAMASASEAAQGKLTLHACGKYAVTDINVIYDQQTPKMIADEVVRILAEELQGYIFTVGDSSLAQRLIEALKLHRFRIATAESFTGGGVGGKIVSVPGASAVFYEGINAYDATAKEERLGVSSHTLKEKGAVSDETAYEMAVGLLASGHCDVAVATTGVAGPDSDGQGAPVGLCYIAVGTRERVRVYRYDLAGDRETVTNTAINLALFLAYREIS